MIASDLHDVFARTKRANRRRIIIEVFFFFFNLQRSVHASSDNSFWRNFRTETVSEQYGYFKSANNSYFPPVAAVFPFNFSPINYLRRPSAVRVFVRNKSFRVSLHIHNVQTHPFRNVIIASRRIVCLKYYIM